MKIDRLTQITALLALGVLGGCLDGEPAELGTTEGQLVTTNGVPLPGSYLNFTPGLNGHPTGLIPPEQLGADGIPMPGTAAVVATENYYAATGSPSMTLDAWKDEFRVPKRGPRESYAAFRARLRALPNPLAVLVYYNKTELGLGRELVCGDWFQEGTNAEKTLGCYVTNYGTAFGDTASGMREADRGANPKNTVCIVYRPGLPESSKVQFFAFDSHGKRQNWAQLDTMGPRLHPQLCTNCHGGSIASTGLVQNARFLPVDPNLVGFSALNSRADQEEDIRIINRLAFRPLDVASTTPLYQQQLSPAQRTALTSLYSGNIDSPGQLSRPIGNQAIPAGWSGSLADKELYTKVVKPNCVTCHDAVGDAWRGTFASKAALASPIVKSDVCSGSTAPTAGAPHGHAFTMPNAQQTMLHFWSKTNNAVTIDGRPYDSPAEAFLREGCFDISPSACSSYAEHTTCWPDGVFEPGRCGNAHSGSACDDVHGGCLPDLMASPSTSDYASNGVCQTDGSLTCLSGQECRASNPEFTSYDGRCFTCGREGQPICQQGPACAMDSYSIVEGGSCTARCGGVGEVACAYGNACTFPSYPSGGTCHACNDDGLPCTNTVYRFAGSLGHFYTRSYNEAIQWNLGSYEGSFLLQRHAGVANTRPLYRCYSPSVGGHGHFYTTVSACDWIPGAYVEDVMGYLSTIPQGGSVDLYRTEKWNDWLLTPSWAEAANARWGLGYSTWWGSLGQAWTSFPM